MNINTIAIQLEKHVMRGRYSCRFDIQKDNKIIEIIGHCNCVVDHIKQ